VLGGYLLTPIQQQPGSLRTVSGKYGNHKGVRLLSLKLKQGWGKNTSGKINETVTLVWQSPGRVRPGKGKTSQGGKEVPGKSSFFGKGS